MRLTTGLVILAVLLGTDCSILHRDTSQQSAIEILNANQTAMFSLNAYRATCITMLTYDGPGHKQRFEYATLTAEKPNKMRYDMWNLSNPDEIRSNSHPKSSPGITFACDGQVAFKQFGNVYRRDSRILPENMSTVLEPWGGLYAKAASFRGEHQEYLDNGSTSKVSNSGTDSVEGVLCDKVSIHRKSDYAGQKFEEDVTCFIAKLDHLVRRSITHVSFDGKPGFTRDAVLKNIETHPAIDPRVYNYKPPHGVIEESAEKQPPPLLANGNMAPSFKATDTHGYTVALSDFKGKVVVVDFWASWCPPCRESMPHTEEVVKEMLAKGIPVVALAVDDSEPKAGFEEFATAHQADYPNLNFLYVPQKPGISTPKYKVSGIPSVFIIDATGVIRASIDGYGGPSNDLRDAIIKAYGR